MKSLSTFALFLGLLCLLLTLTINDTVTASTLVRLTPSTQLAAASAPASTTTGSGSSANGPNNRVDSPPVPGSQGLLSPLRKVFELPRKAIEAIRNGLKNVGSKLGVFLFGQTENMAIS